MEMDLFLKKKAEVQSLDRPTDALLQGTSILKVSGFPLIWVLAKGSSFQADCLLVCVEIDGTIDKLRDAGCDDVEDDLRTVAGSPTSSNTCWP